MESPLGDNVEDEAAEYILDDQVMQEKNNALDLQETMLEDESAKRRERRLVQAERDRERSRRQKEGLPTNFLLVDEHTKEPYSVGVGWGVEKRTNAIVEESGSGHWEHQSSTRGGNYRDCGVDSAYMGIQFTHQVFICEGSYSSRCDSEACRPLEENSK